MRPEKQHTHSIQIICVIKNEINEIKLQLQRLAILEAIMSQEWQYRYFSYNSKWAIGQEIGSMRDGCGSEWFVWISGGKCAYKEFSKNDRRIDASEQLKKIQEKYSEFITEKAFSFNNATRIGFIDDQQWNKIGDDPKFIISVDVALSWQVNDYWKWAKDYYETEINIDHIKEVWENLGQIKAAIKLNPELDIDDYKIDQDEIGID